MMEVLCKLLVVCSLLFSAQAFTAAEPNTNSVSNGFGWEHLLFDAITGNLELTNVTQLDVCTEIYTLKNIEILLTAGWEIRRCGRIDEGLFRRYLKHRNALAEKEKFQYELLNCARSEVSHRSAHDCYADWVMTLLGSVRPVQRDYWQKRQCVVRELEKTISRLASASESLANCLAGADPPAPLPPQNSTIAPPSWNTTEGPWWNNSTASPPQWNTTALPPQLNTTTDRPWWNNSTEGPWWNNSTASPPQLNTTASPPQWNTTTDRPWWNNSTEGPWWNNSTASPPQLNTTLPQLNTTTDRPWWNNSTEGPWWNNSTASPPLWNTTTDGPWGNNTSSSRPQWNTTTVGPWGNRTTTSAPQGNSTSGPQWNVTTTVSPPSTTTRGNWLEQLLHDLGL
ncbi:mucin-5AC isoform X4 [Drosophila willistoni]|uniref:mucin-5AC isoform X4 n=1 Tax=Drosophila willistoni TaxID=7260 RepID=UPI000C26C826|nr:mucin-5AC isoform X4 [Drosophila willistoni]